MITRKKIGSSGESLSELLVAALIISLAMIMLFSGVKVGSDNMAKAHEKYNQYYEINNQYEEAQADYINQYYSMHTDPMPTPPVGFTFTESVHMKPYKHNK